MKKAHLISHVTLLILALVALPTLAHEGDDTDDPDGFNHHDGDHMTMWWENPTPLELIGVYLVFALPIALLVYVDAREQGKNGKMWSLLVMVPLFGMVAALTYVVTRINRRPIPQANPYPPMSPPPPPPPPTPPPRYGPWDDQYDPWDRREREGRERDR
jgi:hypothetical protein